MEARGVSFDAADLAILRDIDLAVRKGERLGIVGPNGSGKSTLLRCFYAWHRPKAGVVLMDGRDVFDVAAPERARAIGVLAQHSEAGLGLRIGDVVALGRLPHRSSWGAESAADLAAIEDALAAVGLSDWRDRPFAPLSGGEKQRVLFARALAQTPSILILDEPTNHLDIRHQLELLEAARRRNITIIATLHDLNLASQWCDRVCLLCEGQVRAIGAPEEVLTPQLIAAAYGVEVDTSRDPRTGRIRLHFHLPTSSSGAD